MLTDTDSGKVRTGITDPGADKNEPHQIFSPAQFPGQIDKLKQHRPEGTDITQLSLDSGSRNPAEELEQQDTVARIRWLIGKLPSLQQTIIRMKDVEGYELAEIAEITGTQVEAVRVNLSRARKKIREQLVKEL